MLKPTVVGPRILKWNRLIPDTGFYTLSVAVPQKLVLSTISAIPLISVHPCLSATSGLVDVLTEP